MPIPEQRDLEATRKTLVDWLGGRLAGASDIEVSSLVIPGGTGYSNETLLFDASWRDGAASCADSYVLRVKPTGYQLFLDINFEEQYAVMKMLGETTDVPMPRMHWIEDDAGWLGAPFFVMGRVNGLIPSDDPCYNAAGFVFDTRLPGNGNQGHDFGSALSEAEKADLVAFMRSL